MSDNKSSLHQGKLKKSSASATRIMAKPSICIFSTTSLFDWILIRQDSRSRHRAELFLHSPHFPRWHGFVLAASQKTEATSSFICFSGTWFEQWRTAWTNNICYSIYYLSQKTLPEGIFSSRLWLAKSGSFIGLICSYLKNKWEKSKIYLTRSRACGIIYQILKL